MLPFFSKTASHGCHCSKPYLSLSCFAHSSPSPHPLDADVANLVLAAPDAKTLAKSLLGEKPSYSWSPDLVDRTLKRLWNHGPKALQFFKILDRHPRYAHSASSFDLAIDVAARLRDFRTLWNLVDRMRSRRLGPNPKTFAIIIERKNQKKMGSLEEERLWQMVHDFIEAEPTTPNHYHQHYSIPKQSTSRCFTLQEILEEKTAAETQILNRIGIHMRKKMEMGKTTKMKKWLATCLKRDGFHACLCHTSWPSTPGCPSGHYEYIDILEAEDGKRVIVDMDFKSQFEVARPTKSYLEVSSHLPSIFVGGEEKLRKVVRLMCIAAEESLKERGLHIPPWRKAAYMNSKWLSTCTREESPETRDDDVANRRDPPSQMIRLKPIGREMVETQRRSSAANGAKLSSHFASMGMIY